MGRWHLAVYKRQQRGSAAVFGGFAKRIMAGRAPWVARIPIPKPARPMPPPWSEPDRQTPETLRTVPGIRRFPEREAAAFADEPLHEIGMLYPKAADFTFRQGWAFFISEAPRFLRSLHRAAAVWQQQPAPDTRPAAPTGDAGLTEEIRREARRLGISTVGFAAYDEKYMLEEFKDLGMDQGTVIVAVMEQRWDDTQSIPSLRAERHAMRTYSELLDRTTELAAFLHHKGYRAQPHHFGGYGIVIHYAVEAGLGQLGLNGQLLTPQAGSRCRILLITTNAQLTLDHPVDYGIEKICDDCQLCIRRCPPGAIPNQRSEHRGVVKIKIRTDRCVPILSQAHGCGVCMKVCPVQRYGLNDVKSHYLATGQILGKGTDALEGYDWVDGEHYGPGEKPRLPAWLTQRGMLDIEPGRKRPVDGGYSMANSIVGGGAGGAT